MQSYYSWSGTRIHLLLEDDLADAYNRAHKKFSESQIFHEETWGTKWTPDQLLLMNWTDEEDKAWHAIADVINLLVKINGGSLSITEEETTSDYLIKL